MYTRVYTCIHMYTHVYTCIHMYTHVYTCIHMYTHVYTCILLYLGPHLRRIMRQGGYPPPLYISHEGRERFAGEGVRACNTVELKP